MPTVSAAERQWWLEERQRRITEEGAIRRIECPFCHARPGEDCHSPSWYSGPFHAGRRKLAGVR